MSHFAEVDRQAKMIEGALYDADRATDRELVKIDCYMLDLHERELTAADAIEATVTDRLADLRTIAARYCGELFDLDEAFKYAALFAYRSYVNCIFG